MIRDLRADIYAIWGGPSRFRGPWFVLTFSVFLFILTQGVVSGFEKSLFQAITQYSGLLWVKQWVSSDTLKNYEKQLRQMSDDPHLRVYGFRSYEGVLVQSGLSKSVLIQVLPDEIWMHQWGQRPTIWFGQRILPKPVTQLRVVLLFSQGTSWQRQLVELNSTEMKDFGKWEFNEKLIVVPESQWTGPKDFNWHGFLVMGQKPDFWVKHKRQWRKVLPYQEALTWYDINRNLFQAIWLERWVILAVVNLVVLTSFFLSWVTLWVVIYHRIRVLSLLRVLGLPLWRMVLVSGGVGALFGILSWLGGVGLAHIGARVWDYVFQRWKLWPDEVYRISYPQLAWTQADWMVSFVGVVLLSLLSFSFITAYVLTRQSLSQSLRFE